MKQTNLADIELLALDVDGVLTDGTLIIHAAELKADFIKRGSKLQVLQY